MDRPPQVIVIDEREPLLAVLDAPDLLYLLELPDREWLGHIVSLNRTERYHNRLNAFALAERLARLRSSGAEEPDTTQARS